MKQGFKVFLFLLIIALPIVITLLILTSGKCEKDFKTYPEYCEFNLETRDNIFKGKKYHFRRISCGEGATLCGEKITCNCEQSSESEEVENNDFITVSGEFECLAVENLDEVHNDLCVYGIKDSDDNHYRLQFDDDQVDIFGQLKPRQKIELSGTYILEFAESFEIYDYSGVILVDSLKYLES